MKKILSLLMAIAILMSYAAPILAVGDAPATLTVDSVTAQVGDTVTLNATMSATAYAGYGLTIRYDCAALELISISKGAASLGFFYASTTTGKVADVAFENTDVEGVIFTMTFRVLTEGTHTVDLEVDGFNLIDETEVPVTVIAGAISAEVEEHICQYDILDAQDATCNEDGYIVYGCSCGNSYTEVIPATGHSWDEGVITVEPTEEAEGECCYTCQTCGETRVEVLPKLSPSATLTLDSVTAQVGDTVTLNATMSATAYAGYGLTICYDTDALELISISKGAASLGFFYASTTTGTVTDVAFENTDVEGVIFTMTFRVLTEGTHTVDLEVDGFNLIDETEVPVTVIAGAISVETAEHICEYTIFDAQDATCTEDGYIVYGCSCGNSYTEVIPATGHSYEAFVTDPTCTEQGYTTYTCHCGDTYVGDHVDALGHDMGQWYALSDAVCTEGGQERRDCSRCDHFEIREREAAGHNYVETVTAPTCTALGYTTHTCIGCGDTYVDSYVFAKGHGYGAWYTVQEATCTEGGQERHDCSRCGHFETRNTAAHGHSYTVTVTDPTCTGQGYTTYTCHCGDSYADSYVSPLGHNWDAGTVTAQPTEDADGERVCTCQLCGEKKTEAIPAVAHVHSYDAVVTAPTCTEQGYTTHTCRCGEHYTDTYVDALGHDYNAWYEIVAPTCTAPGQQCQECARCGNRQTRTTAAHGHSFTEYVSDGNATTETAGTKTAKCDHGCGDSHTIVDVTLGMTAEELLEVVPKAEKVEIYSNGTQVSVNSTLGTGMVVKVITDEQVEVEIEIVITGDLSGDGKITITDMIALKSVILKKSALEAAAARAADVNGDGKITITDFIQMKSHILGMSEIQTQGQKDLRCDPVVYEEAPEAAPAVAAKTAAGAVFGRVSCKMLTPEREILPLVRVYKKER